MWCSRIIRKHCLRRPEESMPAAGALLPRAARAQTSSMPPSGAAAIAPILRWRRWLLALYVASIAVVAVQKGLALPAGTLHGFLRPDNNFAIFRAAFGHLATGRDLYAPYPG